MAQVIITINHREYPIVCEDGGEVQIMKLGRMLDEKAHSLTQALGPVNENLLLAMVGLIVADELSETKKDLANAEATLAENAKNTVQAAVAAATPMTTPASETSSLGVSDEELNQLDDEIASYVNSLNEVIKSVALKLKSI